jgi:hypothetical protein
MYQGVQSIRLQNKILSFVSLEDGFINWKYLVHTYKSKKLRGMSPLANYTLPATATCPRVNANFCGERVPFGQRDGHLQT